MNRPQVSRGVWGGSCERGFVLYLINVRLFIENLRHKSAHFTHHHQLMYNTNYSWRVPRGVSRMACSAWRVPHGVFRVACPAWRVPRGVFHVGCAKLSDSEPIVNKSRIF
jgi:hypothetical protein